MNGFSEHEASDGEVVSVAAPAAPPRWASTDVTIRDVVPGLDSIATQSIPYTRVVGRGKSAYTKTFRRWEDLAAATIAQLLNLPGAAEGTLEQVLDVARADVAAYQHAEARPQSPHAAVTELLDRLDQHHRVLLAGRSWAAEPVPMDQIEQQLGVYAGWGSRYQPKARARFAELLSEPRHHQLCELATGLRQEFGPYVPVRLVARRLKALELPMSSEAARVLLYAAGPYTRCGDWFENRAIGGRKAAQSALDHVFDGKPANTLGELQAALITAGVLPAIAPELLDTLALRKFGDVYVRWGSVVTEQIEAVLGAYGTPLTPADIVEQLTDTRVTESTVRGALTGRPQFVRTDRATWALRSWGMREYRGLADELGHRIDLAGGPMPVAELAEAMRRDFPDASEVSVDMYMQTLAFVIRDGMIRRRVAGDPWPAIRHWNTVPGVYRDRTGHLRVIRSVSSEVLRGTSPTIGKSVARALGVLPGDRKTFRTEHGDLAVTWLLSTPGAPHISSLQACARAVGAEVGDEVVLTFKRTTAAAKRIPPGSTAEQRFQVVTDRPSFTMTALAASLDCRPQKVVQLLTKRGDVDMADAARKLHR